METPFPASLDGH